jgi:hypothetical protein
MIGNLRRPQPKIVVTHISDRLGADFARYCREIVQEPRSMTNNIVVHRARAIANHRD